MQLVLVGPEQEPEYAARIRQRARDIGVADRVLWFGFTADIAPPFRAADIFALPSANEGMPAALVEAMASGLPSIVTAISGMTDLIVDGVQGRVVEPRADRIADALEAYGRDPALRRAHGESARTKVEQRFSSEVVIDAYERLFRRIMAGGDAAE
jgi:glycosyltransferase involved in cell wall biosynthesis